MDLLLFFLAFVIGFGLFISSAYILAKWMFPRLEDEEEKESYAYKQPRHYIPRMNERTHTYSLKKHPFSFNK